MKNLVLKNRVPSLMYDNITNKVPSPSVYFRGIENLTSIREFGQKCQPNES